MVETRDLASLHPLPPAPRGGTGYGGIRWCMAARSPGEGVLPQKDAPTEWRAAELCGKRQRWHLLRRTNRSGRRWVIHAMLAAVDVAAPPGAKAAGLSLQSPLKGAGMQDA